MSETPRPEADTPRPEADTPRPEAETPRPEALEGRTPDNTGWRRPPSTSTVGLTIDPAGSAPPFEQLKTQVLAGIADGSLIAGTKLPAVRVLAAELRIAPNTVARAYRELEADGILETRGRNGTVIKAKAEDTTALGQLAAQAYADRIRELGLDPDDAVSWVKAALS